jgi:hypothetical protein
VASFGDALEKIKDGKKAKRANWEGKFIAMLTPGSNSAMTEQYIYQDNGGRVVPWAPSHAELLSEDWEGA